MSSDAGPHTSTALSGRGEATPPRVPDRGAHHSVTPLVGAGGESRPPAPSQGRFRDRIPRLDADSCNWWGLVGSTAMKSTIKTAPV